MEDFILTKVPFDMEQLQDLFSNPEKIAIIDYKESDMKGSKFLTYIGNINVNCDVKVDSDLPKEERFELIRAYMENNNLVEINSILLTVGSIMTAMKGIDDFYNVIKNPILSKDEIIEFCETHKVMVNKWLVVMDSIILAVIASSKRYVEAFGHPKDSVRQITGETIIGRNFVNLLKLPFFIETFYSKPATKMYYFVDLFEEPIFNHESIFAYITGCALFPLMMMLEESEEIQMDKIVEHIYESVGELDDRK